MPYDNTIRFFFDYVSPYSYLAWTQLPALKREFDVKVEPLPVLFAGLLAANENVGPAEVTAKRAWMIDNVLQTAALLGVRIKAPAYHPFNPLLALRITVTASQAERDQIIDACFRAAWQDALHISEPEVIKAVLDQSNIDGTKSIEHGSGAEAREKLRQNTDDAIASGVFGVPSFILDGRLYWGVDNLALIRAHLSGQELLDQKKAQHWKEGVRPSATRKGRTSD